jgi:hypothetical protein
LENFELAEVADSEAAVLPVSRVAMQISQAEGEAEGSVSEDMTAELTAEANVSHNLEDLLLDGEEGPISVRDVVAQAEEEVAEYEAEAMSAGDTVEAYMDARTDAHQRLILYERARRCLLEAIVTGDITGHIRVDVGVADDVATRLSDKVTLERAILRNTRIVHTIDSILAFRLSVIM